MNYLSSRQRKLVYLCGILILLIPIIYLTWAWRKGPRSPANPWNAKGLEWEKAPSPPPTFNFEEQPIVTEEAYNYAGEEATSGG